MGSRAVFKLISQTMMSQEFHVGKVGNVRIC